MSLGVHALAILFGRDFFTFTNPAGLARENER